MATAVSEVAEALGELTLNADHAGQVAMGVGSPSTTLAGMDDVLDALREVGCSSANAGLRFVVAPCSCVTTVHGASLALACVLLQALSWPTQYAHEAAQLGVRWPKGLLLHGPPGCGKTAAVHAVARECGAVVHVVTASSVMGAFTG